VGRECLDHLLTFSDLLMSGVIREYVGYLIAHGRIRAVMDEKSIRTPSLEYEAVMLPSDNHDEVR
jgi:hypothetical protein